MEMTEAQAREFLRGWSSIDFAEHGVRISDNAEMDAKMQELRKTLDRFDSLWREIEDALGEPE